MRGLRGLADRWQESSFLPLARLLGGLLLVLAGVWVVVAGPLYHQLWLEIVGAAMLVLGAYLMRLGFNRLRQSPRHPTRVRH